MNRARTRQNEKVKVQSRLAFAASESISGGLLKANAIAEWLRLF
jgi:hypothetical protein